MTMTASQRATDIKSKLTDAETAAESLPATTPPASAVRSALAALHASLKAGLDEQAGALGLTATQVGDLNQGGGTNKS